MEGAISASRPLSTCAGRVHERQQCVRACFLGAATGKDGWRGRIQHQGHAVAGTLGRRAPLPASGASPAVWRWHGGTGRDARRGLQCPLLGPEAPHRSQNRSTSALPVHTSEIKVSARCRLLAIWPQPTPPCPSPGTQPIPLTRLIHQLLQCPAAGVERHLGGGCAAHHAGGAGLGSGHPGDQPLAARHLRQRCR